MIKHSLKDKLKALKHGWKDALNNFVGDALLIWFFLSLVLHGGFLRGFFMSVLATHCK